MHRRDNLPSQLVGAGVGDVLRHPAALERASHDASLFELRPRVVVAPRQARDVERLVRFADHHDGVSLTARAAGTDMSGGPLTESIVVSFTEHFTRIGRIGHGRATVQPGVFYRDFERATLKHGLLLPSFPASRELATVGGMVANNSGGELTLHYGQTARYVEALKVVLADGREHTFRALLPRELASKRRQRDFEGGLYRTMHRLLTTHRAAIERARPRVSKNTAGYALWDVIDDTRQTFDLTKLIVGAQGTLGLITEITVRLVPPATHRRLVVAFLRDFDRLGEIAAAISELAPQSFESYDDQTFKVALRFLPALAKRLHLSLPSLAWQFRPELGLALQGGLPKLVLLIEFAGDTLREANERAQQAAAYLTDLAIPHRVVPTAHEARKYWLIRRESFNLLRHHVAGLHTAPFIDDVAVRPEQLPAFLPALYRILGRYDLLYTIAGHVGDGNFHIIPLMDLADQRTKTIIHQLADEVFALTKRFGGSITAEHNDGLIRTPYLPQLFGPTVYRLFQETKRAFDPHDLFNPGKKIGRDLSWSLEHLRTHW